MQGLVFDITLATVSLVAGGVITFFVGYLLIRLGGKSEARRKFERVAQLTQAYRTAWLVVQNELVNLKEYVDTNSDIPVNDFLHKFRSVSKIPSPPDYGDCLEFFSKEQDLAFFIRAFDDLNYAFSRDPIVATRERIEYIFEPQLEAARASNDTLVIDDETRRIISKGLWDLALSINEALEKVDSLLSVLAEFGKKRF